MQNNIPIASQDLISKTRQCLARNDIQNSIGFCKHLNEKYPDNAEGWALASQIALRLNNVEKSLVFIDKALHINKGEPIYHYFYSQTLLADNKRDKAIDKAVEALNICPDNAMLLNQIGTFLSSKCNEFTYALESCKRAVSIDSNNASYQFNLGSIYRFHGNVELAEECWDHTIRLDPSYHEAYLMRSELKKVTKESNHIDQLKECLNKKYLRWEGETFLCYALAKEYEDIGEFDLAFATLKQGADSRRRHIQYDLNADTETIDEIIDTYNSNYFESNVNGYENTGAIFILGMPRTGTTLIERVLSSHNRVITVGELNAFALELVRITQLQLPDKKLSRPELVKTSSTINFEVLGKAYTDSVEPFTQGSQYFIDKMPLNFLYCGLIKLALPNAKIINVKRHPVDTCFAMYKRVFRNAYPMSYDLEELAHYYLAYDKLMQHWKSVLPGEIYEIHYEHYLENQELETRNLLSFCGLEWDDSCLHFEKNPQVSTTASATQVREKLYKTSVGTWKKYQLHLAPLIEIFNEAKLDI